MKKYTIRLKALESRMIKPDVPIIFYTGSKTFLHKGKPYPIGSLEEIAGRLNLPLGVDPLIEIDLTE